MRRAWLASFFIVLTVTAVRSQQAPAPKPDQPSPAPIVRNPHSTKADLAVPLCSIPFNDGLETDGIAPGNEKGATRPIPKFQPEAEFSSEALRLKAKERPERLVAIIGLVVDTKGKPQNVCLAQSIGYGLDANAAKAVQKYQFDPATKDRKRVPIRISVEVEFHYF